MGKVFTNVVTLIVAAEIFSKGLISLGFIDALVEGCTSLGFSGTLVSIVIILILFLAAILMGSGNASFFSFGPLVPSIRRYDIAYAISIEHGTGGVTYCRCDYCYLGDRWCIGYRFGQTQYHSADNHTDCHDSYSLFYLTSNTDYDVQTDSKYTSLCS